MNRALSTLMGLFAGVLLLLGGRHARYGTPAILRAALVGVAAVAILLWAAHVAPDGVGYGTALGWTLLALALIDWRRFVLPDVLTLPLAAAGIAVAWLAAPDRALDHVIGLVAGGAALLAVAWSYRRVRGRDGLGMGDVKLFAALGAWVGWQGVPSVLLLAALAGMALALTHAASGRAISLTYRLPFGSCLAVAGWIVWLYGPIAPAP